MPPIYSWNRVSRSLSTRSSAARPAGPHAGLPPGPICNPGAASLNAAAHPAKTDMLFFVAVGDGTHQFTKNYREHLAVQRGKKVQG